MVGLRGSSGSGKSTLLALCAGFITPRAGQVERVAGLAWLGQAGHLFHGSLRENLQLAAAGEADDALLADAMALAGLGVDDPALPDGLDTRIGEGRRGLSGGQAQRVALARAWLSGARLWLLDEPTRGLDPDTAKAVWQRVRAMATDRGAGVLVATHDPLVLAGAERVLHLVAKRLQEVDDAAA
ncbi:ATP-binding cassette domain-containing protein [Alkalisalibacterium limincola]|uniref:ATP-binding cassette domain-containing protein n=1 Tax=Alkalisalibacterium limincola TaxID=2699169 RepID=UPI002104F93C|nr:ATP-binding cassette domain-containing protein [Alkalisalibacterium limincola]